MLTIDTDRCTRCGLCALHCTESVLRIGAQGTPFVEDYSSCLCCGHCLSGCPSGAISMDGVEPLRTVSGKRVSEETMAEFLLAKRSCRHFETRPVEKALIAGLLDVAAASPSAKNCEERVFIVVCDAQKLAAVRKDVVAHMRRITRLLCVMTAFPFSRIIPSETAAALARIRRSCAHMLARESNGEDEIFYNAPAVVFIGGIAQDPLGKDNALAAQHYLLLQAEATGLGSCIMGYAQAAPKIIAKHLVVPRFYQIYGAVALGYPKHRFYNLPNRKTAAVTWCDEAS